MSSQAVADYLTKQIFIEKNIVTYRSLSRELRLHVNTAKNELAIYHDNAPYHSQTSAATYLLCGEAAPPAEPEDVNMDFDFGADMGGEYENDGDEVPQKKVLLVNERDLDTAKLHFRRLDSIHIYSLAPSPLIDAGLICTPTEKVREADRGKDAKEMVKIVGKIVSSDVKIVQQTKKATKPSRQPVAGPSRLKPGAADVAATSRTKDQDKVTPAAVTEPVREQAKSTAEKPKEKPKSTGKLDFSKAKPKDKQPEAAAEASKEKPKEKEKEKAKELSASTPEPKGKNAKDKLEPPKRGIKRKSALPTSDSEGDASSSAAASKSPSRPPSRARDNVRVQNRTVLSDDEDNAPQPARKPRKSRADKALESETEDARALMDVDDDQVVRVTRETPAPARREEKEEEEEEGGEDNANVVDEDVDMLDDSAPRPKPKKRKEKKVVPRGRNGLKKKRVVKSRSKIDEKGYMVFEDYSEYESVEEEEEPEPAPAKGKTKAKASAKTTEEKEDSAGAAHAGRLKPAVKGSTAPAKAVKSGKPGAGGAKGAQKQGSLAHFFTAKPKS
ncbi:putative DNA polymerase subunit Cdc27 [Lyophyllum shimeji]|uniref:DNA polymerase delta subunit 3 n=1 Tax=Lyophyllum shimeji TaxID=47721 RepID=A0A9P3PUB3_LYOSH|nr:putative DNA polymerase subunit Cdc27 [Lyophyllum shimeji]